jgi:hypothetical protein
MNGSSIVLPSAVGSLTHGLGPHVSDPIAKCSTAAIPHNNDMNTEAAYSPPPQILPMYSYHVIPSFYIKTRYSSYA